MAWVYLLIAILLEVCGTTCMKLSQGFTKPVPSGLMFVFYFACFAAFTMALKRIEVGTAYAIWSGVGTALIAAIGCLYFKESVTTLKIVGLLLIISGVVALNLEGNTH
jgi:small multidrug resistance pump